MSDYKAIHGKNILSLASDLDNAEGEGQIWFNTTSSDYKTIIKVAGAWATAGNVNTARAYLAGSGTQTAGIIMAGGPGSKDETETYDGSSWTETADVNTARMNLAGTIQGTSTATLVAGGYVAPAVQDVVESWDGSSWTEIADLNSARRTLTGAGTQTAGIVMGGSTAGAPIAPGVTGIAETWNGTSWT